MKKILATAVAGLFLGFLNVAVAVADDEPDMGFTKKSGSPHADVEIHYHHHGDDSGSAAVPEGYQKKSGDFPTSVEIHHHYHPEVRDASAEPGSFQKK